MTLFVEKWITLCLCVRTGQQLMLTAATTPVAPQPAYSGYGYPANAGGYPPQAAAGAAAAAAAAGYPAQPAYGFNM